LDRQVGRLLALEDAIDILGSSPVLIEPIGTIGGQPAAGYVNEVRIYRRQPVSFRQADDQLTMSRVGRAARHN
jgi:hypothetical protein